MKCYHPSSSYPLQRGNECFCDSSATYLEEEQVNKKEEATIMVFVYIKVDIYFFMDKYRKLWQTIQNLYLTNVFFVILSKNLSALV